MSRASAGDARRAIGSLPPQPARAVAPGSVLSAAPALGRAERLHRALPKLVTARGIGIQDWSQAQTSPS